MQQKRVEEKFYKKQPELKRREKERKREKKQKSNLSCCPEVGVIGDAKLAGSLGTATTIDLV